MLRGLQKGGHVAYLVGGCVRDILLGILPKDFDIATDAHPKEVRKLFKNCRLIGRRFKLAHVYFGREIIEVSTFRAAHNTSNNGEGQEQDGRITRDNVYGKIDDDVWRRDFTVNALYYNAKDDHIIDYVGGMEDLGERRLRTIGAAEKRYREDPVRMLRAIRLSSKLGFIIHPSTKQPIQKLAPLLSEVPRARLFDEFVKLFMSGKSARIYQDLQNYCLFEALFPKTITVLDQEFAHQLLLCACRNTDRRLAEDKTATPAFLLAAILWPLVRQLADARRNKFASDIEALHMAGGLVIAEQKKSLSMPQRFTRMMQEIWNLQTRLQKTTGKHPLKLSSHRYFRAAYDFLLLRAEAGEDVQGLADWWTKFQDENIHIPLQAKR